MYYFFDFIFYIPPFLTPHVDGLGCASQILLLKVKDLFS